MPYRSPYAFVHQQDRLNFSFSRIVDVKWAESATDHGPCRGWQADPSGGGEGVAARWTLELTERGGEGAKEGRPGDPSLHPEEGTPTYRKTVSKPALLVTP